MAPPTAVYGESVKISKAELSTVSSVIGETSLGDIYLNIGFTQSAISELGNMLAANACTGLSELGLNADISTPTLMQGIFTLSGSCETCTCIEMRAGGFRFNIYVSLETGA